MRKSSASPQQQSYEAQEFFFVLTIADFLLRVQIFVGRCLLVLQTIADARRKTNRLHRSKSREMGFFLDENGDPKAWAGCLLCGFAAMGSDELEEKRDKLKQAEREARWKAAKTPVRK